MDEFAGFHTWDVWFKKAGVVKVATRRGIRINNSAAVLQAAIEGHGVALARSVMARDDIASGRLVRLFPDVLLTSVLAYYVLYRPERSGLARLVAFKDWLFSEVQI